MLLIELLVPDGCLTMEFCGTVTPKLFTWNVSVEVSMFIMDNDKFVIFVSVVCACSTKLVKCDISVTSTYYFEWHFWTKLFNDDHKTNAYTISFVCELCLLCLSQLSNIFIRYLTFHKYPTNTYIFMRGIYGITKR